MIIGDDLEESKAKNATDLSGIKLTRLPARSLTIFGRVFTVHKGLMRQMRKAKPDVIICEAESHFIGYWSAIIYKVFFSPKTRLVLWCFFSLPGLTEERSIFHATIKKIGRLFFNRFISYTTYGKEFLIAKGLSASNISVAVNVCDTDHFLDLDSKLLLSKESAKESIGSVGKFVVSYIGNLDEAKRPELLLEIGRIMRKDNIIFNIVGGGPLEISLRTRIEVEEISNVKFVGKIINELPIYYRASDVIILPGRGGIVISEAMCFGVPVIVYQADGVEYDLVINGHTGIVLNTGSAEEFAQNLRDLMKQSQHTTKIGESAKMLIKQIHNTEAMSKSIEEALNLVVKKEYLS